MINKYRLLRVAYTETEILIYNEILYDSVNYYRFSFNNYIKDMIDFMFYNIYNVQNWVYLTKLGFLKQAQLSNGQRHIFIKVECFESIQRLELQLLNPMNSEIVLIIKVKIISKIQVNALKARNALNALLILQKRKGSAEGRCITVLKIGRLR